MKTISAAMQSHLESGCVTLAQCWQITAPNGTVVRFTDHDKDVEHSGNVYATAIGVTPSDAANYANQEPANMEFKGLYSESGFKKSDLLAGVWEGAEVETFLLNYQDPSQGVVYMPGHKGRFGKIEVRDTEFTVEIEGLLKLLTWDLLDTYTETCRVALGSTACGIDLAEYTETGTVTAVASNRIFVATISNSNDHTIAEDWWSFGLITWTTGNNAGITSEVEASVLVGSDHTLSLFSPPLGVIQPGDTFSLYAGCDHSFATCKEKFANRYNFRGFHGIPGRDELLKIPGRK